MNLHIVKVILIEQKNGSIISSIDDISTDEYEKKAALTALNWMVDNKYII